MPPVAVAFDVIGTLFPLEQLRAHIVALGLPLSGLDLWFASATRDAFALAAAGDYRAFADVLAAALDTVLAEQDLAPSHTERQALLDAMATLDARPDAREALEKLKDTGLPRLALTNGSRAATEGLLDRAGLSDLFERIVSTDDVGIAKPAARVYRAAAEAMDVAPAAMTLVAVHPWDLNGAAAAGLATAFLNAGHAYPPTMRPPTFEASSLTELVGRMLADHPAEPTNG